MADTVIKIKSGLPVKNNGVVLFVSKGDKKIHTLDNEVQSLVDGQQPTDKLDLLLTDKFDSPRYYSGDTSS